MDNIVSIYEIRYIAGIVNPTEYKIEIKSVIPITENFIKEQIETQRPNHKGQIMTIFSPLLIGQEKINEIEFNFNVY